MKRARKVLLFAVCAAMLLATLAGCGGSQSQQTTETTTTGATEGTTVSAEPAALKYLTVYWRDEPADSPGNERIRQVLKEKLNIDVQVTLMTKPSNYIESVNLMIASGEKFDLINIGSDRTFLKRLVSENYLLPIDDLLKSNGQNLLQNANEDSWKFVTVDGKRYAVPWESSACVNNVIMRKDLLDKYSLKAPETIEEYEQTMLKILANETIQGFVMYWDDLDATFAGSFIPTGANNFIDTDGKLKPVYLHANYKDHLATMQRFYGEGILPKDFATIGYGEGNNLIFGGQALCFFLYGASDTMEYLRLTKANVPSAEFAAIKPLKGTAEGSYPLAQLASELCVITKNCANPEAAMKYMNYVAGTLEGWALALKGLEGSDYFTTGKDENMILMDTNKTSIYTGTDYYGGVFRCGSLNKFSQHFTEEGNPEWIDLVNSYNLTKGPEYGLLFDINSMKSKDKQTELLDYITQERLKIIMGQQSIDTWENVVQTWLGKGGSAYIDDMTEQYNAWEK